MGTETKHTPGPWWGGWILRASTSIIGHRENGEAIPGLARVVAHVINRDSEAEANARLIAAAPELLEALKLAKRALVDNDIDETMAGEFEIIEDAIAKATGEA